MKPPLKPYEQEKRREQGKRYEGWAFTFCKAAFLVLLLGRYSLLALSGLATAFYLLAWAKGVREWRCWAKPPWVTLFWAIIFAREIWRMTGHTVPSLSHLWRGQ